VLPLVPYVCMPSPLPRQVRWNRFAQYCSIDFGLPHITVRWAPCIIGFVACSAFTHVTTYRLAKSPYATF
jgi:hypothetical protein